MSLKDTVKNLRTILHEVTTDLNKAENGNKAASQRVRTGTIRLEKVSKLFRKESIKSEKTGNGKKSKSSSKSSAKSSPKSSKGTKAPSSSKNTPKAKKGSTSMSKGSSPSKGKQPTKKKATAKILKKK